MTVSDQLDARLSFYARNEKWMDEWLPLKDELCKRATIFYGRLLDGTVPSGALMRFENKGFYRQLRLYKSEWDTDGGGDRPCIWLEWTQETTFVSGSLRLGIRCQPKVPPTQIAFSKALQESSLTGFELGNDTSSWRVYCDRPRIPPPDPPEYWENLRQYHKTLADFVREQWFVLSGVVDEALRLRES